MSKGKIREFLKKRNGGFHTVESKSPPNKASHVITKLKGYGGEEEVDLIEEFGYAIFIFSYEDVVYSYFGKEEEIEKIKTEKESDDDWLIMDEKEKSLILKYLKIVNLFKKDKSQISMEETKWALQNSNCRSWMAPTIYGVN